MAELPLLVFPKPQEAEHEPRGGGPTKIVKPPVDRQWDRLSPKLESLQNAIDNRRLELVGSADGADPEFVLVITTVGSVENFISAVKRIDGLEWLGEVELDDIAPDDDFYEKKGKVDPLGGRLYLLVTNQQALRDMLSLWKRSKEEKDFKWKHGYTKFRDVFALCKDIRKWDVQDRLYETGAIDAWREELEHFPDDQIRMEIELWYRRSAATRETEERAVSQLITAAGGRVVRRCEIGEIAYHALLAELPRGQVERIVNREEPALVKCDSIMFFRGTGQIAAPGRAREEGADADGIKRELEVAGDPAVAVLDGMPLENHELLQGRIIVDDPDGFADEFSAHERVHGTAMCSLVAHADLNGEERPLKSPIYVRPIMKPMRWGTEFQHEEMPRDQLAVDLIHRAVKRICEGDGREPAVAPTVKIINLSIGDAHRQFTHMMSAWARLIDWLSFKYDVLFVVSSGNHLGSVDLGLTREELLQLGEAEREQTIVQKLYEQSRFRRILAPAESINALAVGGVHHDHSQVDGIGNFVELYTSPLPSPISGFGGGFRRSVKPDLVYPCGRALFDSLPGSTAWNVRRSVRPPGILSAWVGKSAGDRSKVGHSVGTSNAAAIVTHHLGHCCDQLREIMESQADALDWDRFQAPLLKAMIVHGCSRSGPGERLAEILHQNGSARSIPHWISQWLGNGTPDISRVRGCTEQRATVLGYGELSCEKGHVFELPLPPSLGSKKVSKRLTVTLAWFSPIEPTTQRYRNAVLWFVLQGNVFKKPQRENTDWNEVRRGTVQHEVFDADKADVISDGDKLVIKVSCREDAGELTVPVRYGLAVTLEVAPELQIPVYNEIRARIRPEVELRARAARN